MDFKVDKENKKITITREFAAPVSTVWRAWTESKILDQWWAPKPWKARTKSQDFRVDGSWHYSMVGPEGEEHFARADYSAITPQKSFTGKDSFTDADGNINTAMPQSTWKVDFREENGSTIVTVLMTFEKTEDLEKNLEMGFKEGMTAAMENLDDLIAEKAI
jgi:uncharacterized protein YndB with AHSA1/START domain